MKPKPVVVTTICSECGLAWEAHGDNPTTADCIRLLKIELAKRPAPVTVIYPYIYPYTYPYYTWTTGSYTINCTSGNTSVLSDGHQNINTYNDGHTITVNTPTTSTTTCSAISA